MFPARGIESVKALRAEKGGGTPRGPGRPILRGWPIAGIQ